MAQVPGPAIAQYGRRNGTGGSLGVGGNGHGADLGDACAQAIVNVQDADRRAAIHDEQVGDGMRVHCPHSLASQGVRANGLGIAAHHLGGLPRNPLLPLPLQGLPGDGQLGLVVVAAASVVVVVGVSVVVVVVSSSTAHQVVVSTRI